MNDVRTRMLHMARAARRAARTLAAAGSGVKQRALAGMAEAIEGRTEAILTANAEDLDAARRAGVTGALLDRLALDPRRVADMARGLRDIANLPDPIGEVEHETVRPNGLRVGRMRVPLGVIGMVYESRPNVTADAAGLCLKAGNAVILRGGSEAHGSNQAIGRAVSEGVRGAGLPAESVQVVPTPDREAVTELLTLEGMLDCVIPRGGQAFLRWVAETATVPVIQHGEGNCHVFVDASADPDRAADIAFNAKVQRPGVCNAMETLLVHHDVAGALLPKLGARLREAGVEVRACERARPLLPGAEAASERDWATEYLDLILAVRVVDDLDAALDHIAAYGTGHTEAIVTAAYAHAERFLREVDAAAVMVNASTRFSDGAQFGLGAEIGISTQKLHARGPMGVRELTTTKFVVRGQGQVRA